MDIFFDYMLVPTLLMAAMTLIVIAKIMESRKVKKEKNDEAHGSAL